MNELNEPIFIGIASELKEDLPEIDLEVLLAEEELKKKEDEFKAQGENNVDTTRND